MTLTLATPQLRRDRRPAGHQPHAHQRQRLPGASDFVAPHTDGAGGAGTFRPEVRDPALKAHAVRPGSGWIGPPDIAQPATGVGGLDDIVRAQRHHLRLLGRHGPAAGYDAVLTGFLFCGHLWAERREDGVGVHREWTRRAEVLVRRAPRRRRSAPRGCSRALEHTFRTLFAKPLAAAIFLTINGLILLAGEGLRRRAPIDDQDPDDTEATPAPQPATRTTNPAVDANPAPARRLATLHYGEAGPSSGSSKRSPCSRGSAAPASPWSAAWPADCLTATPRASPSCSPPRSSWPPACSS